MTKRARYYLFPRDAYFLPSVRRLVELLEVMDREMELGLQAGGAFQGYVRTRPPGEKVEPGEDPSEVVLESTSFEEFRTRAEQAPGEPKEIQVHLGRPGREPLGRHQLATKSIEVLGFPSLRMIDASGLAQARLLCPSCGERSHFDAAFSLRPDPRYYCGRCGGLTPLPDTRFATGETDEGIRFPCYRFTILFDADRQVSSEPAVLAATPGVVGIETLEVSLGCGLRAILVSSTSRANP